MTFRRGAGRVSSELQRQMLKIERQVEERAVRETAVMMPVSATTAEALTPRLLRSVTDHVSRAVMRQMELDRYRRGG
jgi:hypothetical protein